VNTGKTHKKEEEDKKEEMNRMKVEG